MKTLDNKKVFVSTPETSKAVQEKAFKLGYRLTGPEENYSKACFLFFSNNCGFDFNAITFSDKLHVFTEHSFEEITSAEILAMEVPEPEETFEVFQKVLVRDYEGDEWLPSFYRNKEENVHWVISGAYFNQCMDYETHKHFAFTTGKP